jgi:GNAT superfamily N-acetyltransferase
MPSHHIGFHGETPAELADELAAMRFPTTTLVAVDDADQVRGVLSVDVDPALGRAWWFGPFVDVPAEHPAAAHTLPAVRGIRDSELYGHVEHCRLAAFAQRHGFPPGDYSSLLVLDGVDLVRLVGAVPDIGAARLGDLDIPPADATAAAALIRLHERSFPNTYLSAAALLSGVRDKTVVTATVDGTLVGYAAGGVQPQDYFVDVVAVTPESRCHGIGGALVTTLVQRLADLHGAREAACAVVAGGNAPSRRMLHTLGFRPRLELVSYRLRATSLVA